MYPCSSILCFTSLLSFSYIGSSRTTYLEAILKISERASSSLPPLGSKECEVYTMSTLLSFRGILNKSAQNIESLKYPISKKKALSEI